MLTTQTDMRFPVHGLFEDGVICRVEPVNFLEEELLGLCWGYEGTVVSNAVQPPPEGISTVEASYFSPT